MFLKNIILLSIIFIFYSNILHNYELNCLLQGSLYRIFLEIVKWIVIIFIKIKYKFLNILGKSIIVFFKIITLSSFLYRLDKYTNTTETNLIKVLQHDILIMYGLILTSYIIKF